jgi:hypothetical protein
MVSLYAKSNDLTLTMLTDEHSIIFRQYQAFGFPTILIIDKNGVIRKKIMGNIRIDQLEKLIQNQFDIQKKLRHLQPTCCIYDNVKHQLKLQ